MKFEKRLLYQAILVINFCEIFRI